MGFKDKLKGMVGTLNETIKETNRIRSLKNQIKKRENEINNLKEKFEEDVNEIKDFLLSTASLEDLKAIKKFNLINDDPDVWVFENESYNTRRNREANVLRELLVKKLDFEAILNASMNRIRTNPKIVQQKVDEKRQLEKEMNKKVEKIKLEISELQNELGVETKEEQKSEFKNITNYLENWEPPKSVADEADLEETMYRDLKRDFENVKRQEMKNLRMPDLMVNKIAIELKIPFDRRDVYSALKQAEIYKQDHEERVLYFYCVGDQAYYEAKKYKEENHNDEGLGIVFKKGTKR